MSILEAVFPKFQQSSTLKARIAHMKRECDVAADVLARADAAVQAAMDDRLDGKVGGDVVARAVKAQREAREAYETASQAFQVATDRAADPSVVAANAAENEVWDRIESLFDQRATRAAKLASSIGYFAKAYREVEEINEQLLADAHAPGGRARIDRDDTLLTDESLRKQVYREIQRLGVRFFNTPPPFQELQPLDAEYKNVATWIRELRKKFFE